MFTRYTEISIIFDTYAETILNAMEKTWFSKYKTPLRCITDNGRQFLSAQFNRFLKNKNIEHILSAPNNPTGNSLVERVNKEIGIALRISKGFSLEKLSENIWRRISLNINLNTGYSTYELFHEKTIFDK
ncbi:Gag-Pro-Pol polyprotein [Dictyocoela muelleri]|nr:Gag-Pro-Pol polyprotein [Dictyocoela muelleri]